MMIPETQLLLPRMGLGMAALGRPGYINLERSATFGSDEQRTVDHMQRQANAVLDQLVQLSASRKSPIWLDCARSYGLSEQFVGEYLRSHMIPKDQVYVSSKWGYTYVADFAVALPPGQPHEVKDHSTANFLRQLGETEQQIGEYVNLYQIHSATFESGILTDTTAHNALAAAKQDKGWKIGLSVSSPQQGNVIRQAMRIMDPNNTNKRLFDSVQCTYNVLEQSAGAALQAAHDEAGWDIIIKEGLANGRVLRHPAVTAIAQDHGWEPDALALATILAQPFCPHVLSGAVTPEQLASNWRALDVVESLQADDGKLLKEIMQRCCMDSDEYWLERSALAWN